MTPSPRSETVSSFTIIKGSLIPETYSVFEGWDFDQSKRKNLDRLRTDNFIGASSASWLRDLAKVLNRRFDPNDRDRPLVLLAKSGCELGEWKPILLWHMTRDEFLLRDFLLNWLFPAFDSGVFRLKPEDLYAYLKSINQPGVTTEHTWSEQTNSRVAAGLLKMATDFNLLRGSVTREFASYHLPERSFLYLLHAMIEQNLNGARLIEAPDWRMFLMRPSDVERELLRLHQYRKLEYHAAGSLVQLSLPCGSSREYAERMIA